MLQKNLHDFIVFVREKGVVGLAIGIIIGGAVTNLVNAIVQDLVNPVIGMLTGKVSDLEAVVYQVPYTDVVFKIGHFASSLINFIAIAAVVYFVFMKVPLLRDLDAEKEKTK